MKVVITGASQGIGYAIAETFAKAGHDLFLVSKTEGAVQQAASQLSALYSNVRIQYMSIDLSVKENCIAFAKWVLSFGTPDILINNAGYFLPGSLEKEEDGLLEKLMNANLFSAYHTTRGFLSAMIQKGKGHIFNICSIASLKAYPNGGSYGISKYALHGFTQNLRTELKNKGIKVTGVYPGATYTNSWSGSGIAPERIMEANDIAHMIYSATQLSQQAVVEDIVMRPQLGDLDAS
ncbi:MAG: SDR family oxidoreductase [Chitinophagia bacterium]|jgi:short-subunit dehydrogenase|nr:SDR family oxidoreductase [Chitinophagia bacterium]